MLGVLLSIWTEPIARLLTDEERLLPLLKAYLPISFVGNLFFLLQMALAQYVKISGQPGLVTKCVTVESLGNIVLDLLFVVVLDMGMMGAALASAVATCLSLLVFLPYLRKEPRPFRWVKVEARSWCSLIGKGILRGLPVSIGTVMMAALFIGLNTLFQKTHGANGLFVLSVCVQTLMLSMLVLGGAGSAITGLGGVLVGEDDIDGLLRLLKSVFRVICVGMVAVTLTVFFFPQLIAELFGAEGELLVFSLTPLRVFSLIFLPIGLVIPLSNLYMLINRNMLASAINMGLLVCLLPLVWLMAEINADYIWYAMPMGMWLLLLLTVGATLFISRREKGLHWLYLVHTSSANYNVSVKCDFNDVQLRLTDVQQYVQRLLPDGPMVRKVSQCLEEVMVNELNMAEASGKRGTFDVMVVNQKERLTVIVKDVGKAYNPVVEYRPTDGSDIDESKLNMMIVTGLCQDINYKFMSGLNCLYLNFNKNEGFSS